MKSVHNEDLIDSSAQSLIKLHSKNLYFKHNHCEELNNKLDLRQELFTSSQCFSMLYYFLLSVESSLKTGNIKKKQLSFQTGSQGEFNISMPNHP